MQAVIWRRLRAGDDSGSMPVATLLTVVSLGLSIVLATVVAGEQRNTRVDIQSNDALNAARSGLDVALANLRAATRPEDGSGDPGKLPCATLTDPAAGYQARIVYLAGKPVSGDTSPAGALPCVSGSGLAVLPAYAMIVSTGTAGAQARTLTATYAFTSTVRNDRIEGGVIKTFSGSGGNLCVSAGPAPTVNRQLRVATCNPTDRSQLFTYGYGLTLGLKDTNLCADGRTSAADPTERAGNRVTLQTCAADPVPRQQWSMNDHAAFVGTADGSSPNGLCWNIVSGLIVLANQYAAAENCEDQWSENKSFFPAAAVGTGRAGAATRQLVNSEQFGRCIDVTSDDVTKEHLIVFPCKQSFTGTVLWNQTWALPAIPAGEDSATGAIHTTWNGTRYCLTSPGTTGTTLQGNGQPANVVALRACPGTGVPPADLAWTVRSDTGRWTTSYRIESSYGAGPGNGCLAAADPGGPAASLWSTYNVTFSKLVLVQCSGSDLQKWNTISRFYESSLTDVTET